MAPSAPTSPARRLSALLELTRLGDGREVQEVVEAVARVVAEALDFRVVALNLLRPAWDEMEVVHVHGDAEARTQLLGHREPYAVFRDLLDERWEHRGAYLVPGSATADVVAWRSDAPPPEDPDAWDPDDLLLVPLGELDALLGVLAVDEPLDGRRPDDETLDLLVAAASHATQALRAAQTARDVRRHRIALTELLAVSGAGDLEATFDQTCRAVQEGLGFEKAALLLRSEEDGRLRLVAHRNCEEEPALLALDLDPADFLPLHDPALRRSGCILAEPGVAHALLPADAVVYHSSRNGRGPSAWSGHWLLAPVAGEEPGEVAGYVWADDPLDRLLPDDDELTTLALLADQVAHAIEADRRLRRLRHLVDHDPLTGVRNRRGLEEHVAGLLREGGAVVLVCDLDHFKRVNDVHGHAAGDDVLARFGALLREVAADARATAFRTGGEEFCLVLAGPEDREATGAVTQRLRVGAAGGQTPLTLSIGVAASGEALCDVGSLLGAADQALYTAKRRGRDRVVRWSEAMRALGVREDEAARAQLEAVLSLAEALDLRDPSTASHSRTVAELAERLGAQLGLAPARVRRLRMAGALHDLGKVGVADAVLHKPGPLDDAEWAAMRRHPELGAQILSRAGLADIAGWVHAHHERVDGRGYPRALPAEKIPLEARILAVADAYEAMTADRPYKAAMPEAAAQAELHRCAGSQFDPAVVDALVRALGHV